MLPSVAAYLESLPDGLDSYPGALTKGAVVRTFLGESGVLSRLAPGDVPGRVEDLLRDLPPVGTWVREVHFCAAIGALMDRCFPGVAGMAAFQLSMLERNRQLLTGPLYKILFMVVSPERVFLATDQRWSAFHRGSALKVIARSPQAVRLELSAPPHLFPDYYVRAIRGAIQAAGEAAGCKSIFVELLTDAHGPPRFDLRWT